MKTKNTERNKFKVRAPLFHFLLLILKKKNLHKGRILEEAQRRARPRKFAERSNLKCWLSQLQNKDDLMPMSAPGSTDESF